MNPPNTLIFKRGDTVRLSCVAYDESGAPAPLTGVTVAASVRHPDEKITEPVANLVYEAVNESAGTYVLWAPGNGLATDWPLGTLRIDIQYSQPLGERTLRRSTETFFLRIDRDETP